ncbi:MAG: acylphosphatase [Bacteroidetes bacterium]|nr:acylphosphatase [Bacteroidota bacterium]MBS1633597.1 acylphosphatase [Bacteroidota bacterium]
MLQTISIIVFGKVQGVYFRQSTKEIAQQLNITGEVKNLRDGTVEIIATGTAEQLDQLARWCKQGPPKAIVNRTEIKHLPLQEFIQFSIVRF